MVNYSSRDIIMLDVQEKEILIKALEEVLESLKNSEEIRTGKVKLKAQTRTIPVYPNGLKSEYTGWKTARIELEYKE